MTPADPAQPARLPLWRAVAGFGVLGSLVAVLLLLAPVYLQNNRLSARLQAVVATNAKASEDALRTSLLAEARALDLPVLPGDIKFTHASGKVEVQVKYVVQKSLGPYRVDLHFHPTATTK